MIYTTDLLIFRHHNNLSKMIICQDQNGIYVEQKVFPEGVQNRLQVQVTVSNIFVFSNEQERSYPKLPNLSWTRKSCPDLIFFFRKAVKTQNRQP